MTDLVKKESNIPATYQAPQNQILGSDVIIPRLLLMQGLSDFVGTRKAQIGDMVRSTTIEKLGDDKNPIEIIPLTVTNTWQTDEWVGSGKDGKWNFCGIEPRTSQNENLPWDFELNGVRFRRTKVIQLLALLPKDIDAFKNEIDKAIKTGEMPDIDKVLLPVAIRFKSTSYNAGRTVVTLFTKATGLSRELGVPIPVYGKTLLLSCTPEKSDKGHNYFAFMVDGKGKKTEDKYLEIAKNWYSDLMSIDDVRVDTAGEE